MFNPNRDEGNDRALAWHPGGDLVVNVLVSIGAVVSRAEGKRLCHQGGVVIGGVPQTDPYAPFPDIGAGVDVRVGKRRVIMVLPPPADYTEYRMRS